MNRTLPLLPALALLALAACQSDSDPVAVPAAGSALYRVTFEATWSAGTHAAFPAGAHFSPLIGLSHRAENPVFGAGQLASLGVKNMAELGNNTALRTEINAQRSSGGALGLLGARGGFASPGTFSATPGRNSATAPTISRRPRLYLPYENLSVADCPRNCHRAGNATLPSHRRAALV